MRLDALLPGLVTALLVGSAGLAHAAPADEDADLVVLDGGFAQLALLGLIQVQAAPWLGDDALVVNGDPADTAGFRLRRARLGMRGYAWGTVDWELSLQASGEGINLQRAYVAYRGINFLHILAGVHDVPFSRFALAGAGHGALADRPFGTRGMAPFDQLGLSIEGEVGESLLKYAVGAFNGFTRGASFFEGYREEPALDGNRFTNLAYAARVEIAPLGKLGADLPDFERKGIRIGVGGSFYFDPGKTVETLGWGVDFILKFKGLHLAAELLMDSASPTHKPTTDATVPGSIDRMSVVTELGYMILPDILGVTARFELLDDNKGQDNAGDEIVFTGGVQYYLHRQHLKAQLEYTHREELKGIALDNDALVLQLQFQL